MNRAVAEEEEEETKEEEEEEENLSITAAVALGAVAQGTQRASQRAWRGEGFLS